MSAHDGENLVNWSSLRSAVITARAHENHDEFHEGPKADCTRDKKTNDEDRGEPTQNGEHQLDDSAGVVTQVEVVNSQGSQEERQQSCGDLGLARNEGRVLQLLCAGAIHSVARGLRGVWLDSAILLSLWLGELALPSELLVVLCVLLLLAIAGLAVVGLSVLLLSVA